MNDEYEMLEEAIAALSNATKAMQTRLSEVMSRMNDIRRQRGQYVQSEVQRLLPNFSSRTLDTLKREVPAFVTTSVYTSFSVNRKVFGMFKRSGYDSALAALQARLASHIDQTRQASLAKFDVEIVALDEERSKLELRLHETTLNLSAMATVLNGKRKIPPAVATHVDSIVERYRRSTTSTTGKSSGLNQNRQSYASATNFQSSSSPSDSSSDGDLWFYMITDIPTSFRTWLLSSMSHQHAASAGDCSHQSHGASAAFDTSNNTSPGFNNDMGVLAASVEANAIATDDRLGVFS